MQTFKDMDGREWRLSVTVGSIKRVKQLVDIDLTRLDEGDPPLLTRLGTDVMLLCDVIYALVQPQASERNITDEDFGQSLGGDVITHACDALWKELRDFFLSIRRSDQASAIQKQMDLIKAAVKAANQRVDAIDPERIAASAFSNSVTNSPVESESTPTT